MPPIFQILRRAAADPPPLQRVAAFMLPGPPHFVPLLNFFAPVYMGLAFTHYGLDTLAQSRKEPST